MIKNLASEYAEDFTAFVIDHLKESGQYESVFNDYARRYGMAYANDESFKAKIEEEIVAEHCFEALTNKEQWEKFAGEHKSLAEKIKDFIKEFVAMINKAFDKYFVHDNAYIRNSVMSDVDYMNKIADMLWTGVDEAAENYRFGVGTENVETKYQLVGETSDGVEVYETSQDVLNMTAKERKKAYLDLMRNEYAGRTARFVRNGHTYYAEFDRKNYSKPIYGEKHNSKRGLAALIRSGADGDVFDLVENSRYADSGIDTKNHKAKDGFTDYFDYFVKTVQIDGRVYDLTATVKKQYGEKNGFTYSLFLKDNKKIKAAPTKDVKYIPQRSAQPLSNTTVPQKGDNVNTHSMQKSKNNSSFSVFDSNGNRLSENQQKYFANSKVRDKNGNLKIMYRGGNNSDTVFRRENTHGSNLYGRGFYFTDSESHAKQYGTITEYYLKIDNPLSTEDHKITKAQLRNFIDTIANDEEYGIDNYGQGATVDSVLNSVWGKDDFSMIQDINATAIGDMVEATKIFNNVNGTNYDGFILDTETVIFNSEQAKLTDNQNPTDNPDVRYSTSDSDRLNELQSEYRELEKKVDSIKSSDEYKRLLDIISTGAGDALDEAIKEYGKFTHSSGLYAASKRMSEITGEQKDLRARIDGAKEQSRNEFMRTVDDLTDRQKAEYAQKAVDTFGTTERVDLASYILTNGEMLDFSDGQGYRVKDHREISEILDMPDSAEYSDSLVYFMNMGNIRMQTYGIDISAAPNAEQISRLRDVIPEIMKDNDEFSVDFSKKNGYSAGSVTYPKGTATSKILSDINEFFESGTVPVYESEYGEFRYSVSESFEEQVDGVLNNTFDKNNHIYMGNTPNSLQSILHLQNRPMLITPTHVYTMTVSEAQAKADGRYVKGRNYHDLGKDILLGLPKALEKPLFLIKSSAKQNDLRIIAVTSLTDKNGVNILAAIKPDGRGFYSGVEIDSNFVLSGYGKSNVLNYVLNAKKEGRILYASEKNNRLGKSTPGVQFPDTTFTADYSNSLSQYRETVNKYYAQNDKEYLSNSNKYKSFELSDEVKNSISDAGMRLTDDAELSSLMRNNADYKAEIERLKGEFVKSKRMGGKGTNRLVQTDINRIARNIIGEYSSGISFFDLKDELTGLYGFIANSEKNSWDYAYAVQAANNIAKSVIAQSFVNITPETFESYKKELRSHRLIPNIDDVAEMTAMFGTFGAAYRQYGKKLNMRVQGTENAVHIDEIWDDLCAAVIRDVLYIFQSPTRPPLPNTSFLQSSSGPLFAAAYG